MCKSNFVPINYFIESIKRNQINAWTWFRSQLENLIICHIQLKQNLMHRQRAEHIILFKLKQFKPKVNFESKTNNITIPIAKNQQDPLFDKPSGGRKSTPPRSSLNPINCTELHGTITTLYGKFDLVLSRHNG